MSEGGIVITNTMWRCAVVVVRDVRDVRDVRATCCIVRRLSLFSCVAEPGWLNPGCCLSLISVWVSQVRTGQGRGGPWQGKKS